MKVLEIFDQPEAEYLGEAYVAVTPESIKEMLVRINPNGELSDYDAIRMYDQRGIMFQWLDVGMADFAPFTHVAVNVARHRYVYRIGGIRIGSPQIAIEGCARNEECFIVEIDY